MKGRRRPEVWPGVSAIVGRVFGNQGGASGMTTRNKLQLSYDPGDGPRERVLEFACGSRTKEVD